MLQPLLQDLASAIPPVGLLAGIEARIEEIERVVPDADEARWRKATRRRLVIAAMAGALAGAMAGSLASTLLPSGDGADRPLTALLEGGDAVRLLYARTEARGRYLRLRYGGPARAANGDLEIWRRARGETLPHSIGLLTGKGMTTILPLSPPLRPGEELLVTEELAGGSPLLLPTGRVVMQGVFRHGD